MTELTSCTCLFSYYSLIKYIFQCVDNSCVLKFQCWKLQWSKNDNWDLLFTKSWIILREITDVNIAGLKSVSSVKLLASVVEFWVRSSLWSDLTILMKNRREEGRFLFVTKLQNVLYAGFFCRNQFRNNNFQNFNL